MKELSWRCGVAALVLAVGQGAASAQEDLAAKDAVSGSQTQLESQIERTRADLEELEALEKQWRTADAEQERLLQSHLESVLTLKSRLDDAEPGSAEVEMIWDEAGSLAREQLQRVTVAIDAASRPLRFDRQQVARRTSSLGGGDRQPQALSRSEAGRALEELEDRERFQVETLSELELDLRMSSVSRHLELASRIWTVREEALHLLPPDRRVAVMSLEGEGRGELNLEIDALVLVARVQLLRIKTMAQSLTQGLKSFLSALKAGALAVKILLVFVLWRWAQANRGRYTRRLRAKALEIEDPTQRQRVQSGVEFIEAVAPWGIFLGTILLLRWVLGGYIEQMPGLGSVFIVVLIYGVYRLLSDLAVGVIADAMGRVGVEVSTGFRESLTKRVRWVLRVGTIGAVVVNLVSYRLGEGVLYLHLRNFAVATTLLLLFGVLGGLKEEIGDLFLATRAHGKLARLVRGTKDRFSGRLVAPVAFLWLIGWSLFSLIRSAFSGFEGARSASAFISRRRLERFAEREGYADGDLEALPEELVAALTSTITGDDLEALGRFPSLDVVLDSVAAWRDGEGAGSFLLAGDEGVGKRAWLGRFVELAKVENRIELDRRLMNGPALMRLLSRELLGEDESLRRVDLVSRIEAGERRIVVIERAERLFLSTVNGYNALAELGPVVDATRHHLFWVLSMGGLAWSHLRAAGKDLAFLRRQEVLTAWSEMEIRDLIRNRLAGSGFEVSYAGLMATERREEDEKTRQRMGEQAAMNLIADFAGGNPKVALHYFLRSIVNEGDSLKARPFKKPPEAELEATGDAVLFMLAAIARHGSLTSRETARATDYPADRVQARLIRMQDLGVVAQTSGSYRITTEWRSTLLRVLRRHNILIA